MHMINVSSNRMLAKHDDNDFAGIEERDKIDIELLSSYIKELKNAGFQKEKIRKLAFKDLGFKETNLPIELVNLMDKL